MTVVDDDKDCTYSQVWRMQGTMSGWLVDWSVGCLPDWPRREEVCVFEYCSSTAASYCCKSFRTARKSGFSSKNKCGKHVLLRKK